METVFVESRIHSYIHSLNILFNIHISRFAVIGNILELKAHLTLQNMQGLSAEVAICMCLEREGAGFLMPNICYVVLNSEHKIQKVRITYFYCHFRPLLACKIGHRCQIETKFSE